MAGKGFLGRLRDIAFGPATNGGVASGGTPTSAQAIKGLETSFDVFTGELFERHNVISPEVKETVGRIQAATIAVVRAYDEGDAAVKKSFEDSGLITENYKSKEKEFNAGTILDIAKTVDPSGSIEVKANAIADALQTKVKSVGITDAQIQDGLAINATRGGANQDPAASTAVPITPIYNALDPNLGAAGKQIAAIHIAIRSGLGRIQTAQLDRGLADKAQKTNFNGKIFNDDAAFLKRMLRSGTRLNAFERGEDGALSPLPEDVKNIQDGIKTAINNLKNINNDLGGKADLSELIKQAEEYFGLTKGWKPESTIKATATAGATKAGFTVGSSDAAAADNVEVAANPFAAIEVQLRKAKEAAQKAREAAAKSASDAFNGPEDNDVAQLEKQENILKAIINGFGSNIAIKPLIEFQNNGTLSYFAETFDVDFSKKGESTFTAKDKSYSFDVKPDGVYHNDTNSDISAEEAIKSASAIKLFATAVKEGVTIGGSDIQKAMYYMGLQKSAPDLKVLNQAEIDAIPPAVMNIAKARMEAFLDERTTPDGKPDYKSMAVDAANDNQASNSAPRRTASGPTGGTRP